MFHRCRRRRCMFRRCRRRRRRSRRSHRRRHRSIRRYLPSFLLIFLIHVFAPSVAFSVSRYGTRGVNQLTCKDKKSARRNNLNLIFSLYSIVYFYETASYTFSLLPVSTHTLRFILLKMIKLN